MAGARADMRLSGVRIAYVLEATAGGTRKHLHDLAFGMQKEGAEILLAVSPGREPDYHEDITAFREAGMGTAVLPMKRHINPFRDAFCALYLWRILKRFKPDVVHSHGAKAGGLSRLTVPLMSSAAFVHTPHTLPFDWAAWPSAGIYRLLEGVLGKWTDRFVALTEDQGGRLLQARAAKRPSQVVVIPNGIAAPPALSRDSVRKQWSIPEDAVVALQVARLAPQKACGTFVRAAAEVADVENLVFVLVGDGPLRSEIESQRSTLGIESGRFRMMGYVPNASNCFRVADFMVLTSLYEGLPYVILEAASLGLPVIAPDIPGVREIVKSGENGILVEPGNAHSVAEAVRELALSPHLRRRMGERGRSLSQEEFALEGFLDAHARLYRSLTARLDRAEGCEVEMPGRPRHSP